MAVLERARLFHERWGGLIQFVSGSVTLALAIVVAFVSLQVLDQTALAERACERSKMFGPYFARDYERRGVLPPALMDDYRATIPRSCA